MRGFTLVEIVLTVAIGLLMSFMVLAVYGNMHSDALVFDTAKQVVQTLRLAKEENFSGLYGSQHGVYFVLSPTSSDSAIIYSGSSFASRNDIYDRTINFSSGVNITARDFIFFGNNVDINFSGINSTSSNSGVFLINQTGVDTIVVSVSSSGFINW